VQDTDVFTTIISFHEQIGGWYKNLARPRKQRDVIFAYEMLERVIANFAEMQVLSFDDAAAIQFESLKKQRVRVGTMDLRIAAITLANDMTLLTRNTVDFERVPGLKFEDWTLPIGGPA
jgi:tRNA(fMet)-specific endonuclease VapC